MNVLAPWGFYGWGNIGDEATLQGFARLVAARRPVPRVWISSQNPKHTRRIVPEFNYFQADRRGWKRWWAEKLASGVVVAGGTPIMDCLGRWPLCDVAPLAEEAHRGGMPVAFIGIGTEGLQHDESRQIVGQQLGRHVGQWTVRSQRDSQRLIEWGVPQERVHVAADMAWLLEPASPEWGRKHLREWGVDTNRRVLAVNLLGEKHILRREPRLFEKLAEFLDSAVVNHNVFVLFLSNEVREGETFDKAAAHKTLAAMKHHRHALVAPNEYLAPQQMCSLIANSWVTMSMRYHFCLFAALQRVPFIALKRSDKVADLCFDLDWPHGEAIDGLTPSVLVRTLAAIEQQHTPAAALLADRVQTLRNRAWSNDVGLESLARPLAQTA